MKTTCPLLHIAMALWDSAGHPGILDYCHGPKCQWWPKCRLVNQCPKCGQTGAKQSFNVWECPEHGKFDSWGDFIPTEDQA